VSRGSATRVLAVHTQPAPHDERRIRRSCDTGDRGIAARAVRRSSCVRWRSRRRAGRGRSPRVGPAHARSRQADVACGVGTAQPYGRGRVDRPRRVHLASHLDRHGEGHLRGALDSRDRRAKRDGCGAGMRASRSRSGAREAASGARPSRGAMDGGTWRARAQPRRRSGCRRPACCWRTGTFPRMRAQLRLRGVWPSRRRGCPPSRALRPPARCGSMGRRWMRWRLCRGTRAPLRP